MLVTSRVSPCLTSGDDCRPAPDIVVPLIGSAAALDRMAKSLLQNPDAESCAYRWISAQITTDLFLRFREWQVIPVLYNDVLRPAVIWGAVRIEQAQHQVGQQSFDVRILISD